MPRRSKGARNAHTVRVPTDHDEVYQREASRRGMDYGTYVAYCMARLHDLPVPADWNVAQEELPLSA
jgi:hypothetical protein